MVAAKGKDMGRESSSAMLKQVPILPAETALHIAVPDLHLQAFAEQLDTKEKDRLRQQCEEAPLSTTLVPTTTLMPNWLR